MVDQGYITQAQADAANNEPLPDRAAAGQPDRRHRLPHHRGAARTCSTNPRPRGNTEKERSDKILKGGLKIYTTFDPNLQDMAVDATTNAKPQMGADWVVVAGVDRSRAPAR